MAKKSVNDPGSLGWTDDGNGFWSWSGDGDGSDCAGMVVSATEPTDPIEGMQWLNSDTAEVFIFDGAVWLEFPAGSGGSGGGLWEANGDDIYYSDGNVGVGTSVPQKPLSVYGGILAATNDLASTSGITIDSTATAGYAATITHTDLGIEFDPNASDRDFIFKTGNVGIGVDPARSTFDLSAKEQLAEWKTKAKKASWPIVTDGAFEQEPTEDLVSQWIETRVAGAKLQVAGNISASSYLLNPGSASAYGVLGSTRMEVFDTANKQLAFYAGTKLVGTFKADGNVNFSGPVHLAGRLLVGSAVTPAIGSLYQVIHNTENTNCYSSWSGKGNTAGVLMGTDATGKCAWYTYTGAIGSETTAPTMQLDPSGNLTTQGTVNGTRMIQDGAPVIDAKGLISTLATLRKATMDETQDIRESLRSAIDELISGFEQEIATMPAPEPEVSTMPAGDSE